MSEWGREPQRQRPLAHMDTRAPAAAGGDRHVPASCPTFGVAGPPSPLVLPQVKQDAGLSH